MMTGTLSTVPVPLALPSHRELQHVFHNWTERFKAVIPATETTHFACGSRRSHLFQYNGGSCRGAHSYGAVPVVPAVYNVHLDATACEDVREIPVQAVWKDGQIRQDMPQTGVVIPHVLMCQCGTEACYHLLGPLLFRPLSFTV
jgi:hypothetical protein